MKRLTLFLLAGAGGFAAWIALRSRAQRRSIQRLRVTRDDLAYQDFSEQDLNSAHLMDLNRAEPSQLATLNLGQESLERLIENRPYRSKLELVSRMVLTEAEYEVIKDKIGVAHGREPVKIAS